MHDTSIPRKYSIFIQQLHLFHFRKIFSEKRVRLWLDREKWQKIVRLTAEPWELAGLKQSNSVSNLTGVVMTISVGLLLNNQVGKYRSVTTNQESWIIWK